VVAFFDNLNQSQFIGAMQKLVPASK